MSKNSLRILFYAIYGIILGLIFPLTTTAIKLRDLGIKPNWNSIVAVHLSDPAMLIVDAAPIILGAAFVLSGFNSARIQETSRQLAENKARELEQSRHEHFFLEALIRSTSFAIVRLDSDHLIITCNEAFENLFGYTREEIIGRHLDDMIASDDLHREASQISESVSQGNVERLISKRRRKDGSLVDVEIVGVPVTVDRERIGILGLYHDISVRLNTENALRVSESRFKNLFNESPIALWEEDFSEVKTYLEGLGDKDEVLKLMAEDPEILQICIDKIKILDVNQATLDLYNAKSKDDLLSSLANVLVDESYDPFRDELQALISGEITYDCEIIQRKISGEKIHGWLRLSLPPECLESWERVYISIVDITERKQTEEKMRYMSFHDALTGLYNRAYFEEELQRLNASRQYPISIIACDLDDLKTINDQHGHQAGDRALQAAAKILGAGTFRKEDVVARTGGDEFMIILPAVDISENPAIIQRIENGIAKHNNSPMENGLYRPISISVGYAVVHQGESLEEGYKKADAAMYEVKMARKVKLNQSS